MNLKKKLLLKNTNIVDGDIHIAIRGAGILFNENTY